MLHNQLNQDKQYKGEFYFYISIYFCRRHVACEMFKIDTNVVVSSYPVRKRGASVAGEVWGRGGVGMRGPPVAATSRLQGFITTHALFTTPPTVIQFALVSAMPNARGKGLQFLYAER